MSDQIVFQISTPAPSSVEAISTRGSKIDLLATNIAAIDGVYDDINGANNVGTVAADLLGANYTGQVGGMSDEIAALYAIRADIEDVAVIDAETIVVAGIAANVTTVANNISDINSVNNNTAAILAAATTATDKASEASGYAAALNGAITTLNDVETALAEAKGGDATLKARLDRIESGAPLFFDKFASDTLDFSDSADGEFVHSRQTSNPSAFYDVTVNTDGTATVVLNRDGGAVSAFGFRSDVPRLVGRKYAWAVSQAAGGGNQGNVGYAGISIGFDSASQGDAAGADALYITARNGFVRVEDRNTVTVTGYTITLVSGAIAVPSGYAGGSILSAEYEELMGNDGIPYALLTVQNGAVIGTHKITPLIPGRLIFCTRGEGSAVSPWTSVLSPPSWRDPGLVGVAASGEDAPSLWHIPLHGQSNATADQSLPLLTTAPTGWGTKMFARGVTTYNQASNGNTPQSRPASDFNLTDAISAGVETRAPSMGDAFKSSLAEKSRRNPTAKGGAITALVSCSGLGGRRLTELGPENHGASGEVGARPPGGMWPTLLDDVARAQLAAQAAGYTYYLPFWCYDQGEREGDLKIYENGSVLAASALIASYQTKAIEMADAFSTYANGVGGAENVPVLVTPPNYNALVPTAWLNASNTKDNVFVVGPRYQMPSAIMSTPRGDNIHYSPDGQRWIGEMVGKVGGRIMRGENWKPLQIVSAKKTAARTIVVKLHVPYPPLIIDTDSYPAILGFGFEVYAGTVDAKTDKARPTAAVVTSPDEITLTFAADLPLSCVISTAVHSTFNDNRGLTVTNVGSTTLNGASAYTLTFAGDLTSFFNNALQEGAFYAYGDNPSSGVIRAVSLVSGNTVLTGENSELRTGGSYVAFTAGDLVDFGRFYPSTNVRDSDTATAINKFAAGPKTGKYFDLYNYLATVDGISVTG